jgi:hypothetical protein
MARASDIILVMMAGLPVIVAAFKILQGRPAAGSPSSFQSWSLL